MANSLLFFFLSMNPAKIRRNHHDKKKKVTKYKGLIENKSKKTKFFECSN